MNETVSAAERFSSKRGGFSLALGGISLCWSLVVILSVGEGAVGTWSVVAWIAWTVLSLGWVFGLPGWLRWSAREKSLINDELVRDHQRTAALWGGAALLLGLAAGSLHAIGYVDLPRWWPVAVLGIGVSVAAFGFGALQVRASQ